jgi:hypothetical protein
VERVVLNALALLLESPSGEGDPPSFFPDSKFFGLAAENRLQRQVWIEMIGSQPVASKSLDWFFRGNSYFVK